MTRVVTLASWDEPLPPTPTRDVWGRLGGGGAREAVTGRRTDSRTCAMGRNSLEWTWDISDHHDVESISLFMSAVPILGLTSYDRFDNNRPS